MYTTLYQCIRQTCLRPPPAWDAGDLSGSVEGQPDGSGDNLPAHRCLAEEAKPLSRSSCKQISVS